MIFPNCLKALTSLLLPYKSLLTLWRHLLAAYVLIFCQWISESYIAEESKIIAEGKVNAQEFSQYLLPMKSLTRHVSMPRVHFASSF